MPDWSAILNTVLTVAGGGLFSWFVVRVSIKASKRATEAQRQLDARTAATQGQVQQQGQVIAGEAQFRSDALDRVTNLERRIDEMSLRLDESNKLREQQGIDAARLREVDRMRYEDKIARDEERHDAEVAFFVQWGTWSEDAIPRRAPQFIWPPNRP